MAPARIVISLLVIGNIVSAHAQTPGTRDIVSEFPEFTQELEDERLDLMDFEYSRLIGVSLHGHYDLLTGGLAKTTTDSLRVMVSLDYFMTAQVATIVQAGYSSARSVVDGVNSGQPFKFTVDRDYVPITAGFRLYFGHPAEASFFQTIGLHIEGGGGGILRWQHFTITTNIAPAIALKDSLDINGMVYVQGGVEFTLVEDYVYVGAHVGYIFAFFLDENEKGFGGEDQDGDWITFGIYVMAHLH